MRVIVFVLALIGSVTPLAAQQARQIGPWNVSVTQDRFNDGNDRVIALRIHNGMAFGVRCLDERSFTLALAEGGMSRGSLNPGDLFDVSVRVDRHPIEEVSASAVSDRVIEIHFPGDKAWQLLGGREIAFRITSTTSTVERLFPLSRAREALPPVFAACDLARTAAEATARQ